MEYFTFTYDDCTGKLRVEVELMLLCDSMAHAISLIEDD